MAHQYQSIIDDAMRALDASKSGESHPRLNQMLNRTIDASNVRAARIAAFYPKLPTIYSDSESGIYMQFNDPRAGVGGSNKVD